MFTWETPQPLPSRLGELLDRAGAIATSGLGEPTPDVYIFLPPDLILSSCTLSLDGIKQSYRSLMNISLRIEKMGEHSVLVNGSRLLALTAAELKAWMPGHALPGIKQLSKPSPVDAILTKALIETEPELLNLYLALDERSERGGADTDQSYHLRISSSDPELLIDDLNSRHPNSGCAPNDEQDSQQIIEIERECERQYLITRELESKLKFYRHAINRYEQLMSRHLSLKGRFI